MGRSGSESELSDSEKNFVNTYPLTWNINLTAKQCGISNETAHRYLRKARVKDALAVIQTKVAEVCSVTVEECLNELQRIAFFDHRSYLKNFKIDPESGDLGVDLKDFEEMDTRALQEISCRVNAQGIPYVTFKPYNKVEALKELLNRLNNTVGDRHLHLHIKPEEMKNLSTQEVASTYQQLVQKATK